MFKDDKFWLLIKYWWKFKAEEELFMRLHDNPVWPFKSVGDGYYAACYRSDRFVYGVWMLVTTGLLFIIMTWVLGPFPMSTAFFIIMAVFVYWALYGKTAWRELLICRRGKGKYMLRILQNEEIIFQHEIRNIYIRLTRRTGAVGENFFCLVLGGFEIDDKRLTRMTKAEGALRNMGMKIASGIGINFFDYKDESEEHLIWHYRLFSKIKYKSTKEGNVYKGAARESIEGKLDSMSLFDVRQSVMAINTMQSHNVHHPSVMQIGPSPSVISGIGLSGHGGGAPGIGLASQILNRKQPALPPKKKPRESVQSLISYGTQGKK